MGFDRALAVLVTAIVIFIAGAGWGAHIADGKQAEERLDERREAQRMDTARRTGGEST